MEIIDSQVKLDDIVAGLNKKRTNYLLLRGSSVIAIVFFLTMTAASALSLLSSNPIYYALLKIVVLLFLVFAVVREIIFPILRRSGTANIYQELEKISKGLGEDTLSALELKENIKDSALLGTSKELAVAHIDKTANKLGSLNLSSLYPLFRLRKYYVASLALFIIAAAAVIFAPGGFQNHLLSFNLGPAKTNATLELADIEITLIYPAYTKRPPQIIKGTKGDIEVLKGTTLKFQAEPLDKFEKGSLVVENGISVPVAEIDGKIRAEFTVLSSGSFTVEESSKDLVSESFKIVMEEDNDPVVKISSPSGDTVELGSEEKIDIFYEAEDDFELSKLTLSWENQREQSESPIGADYQENSKIEGKITWGPSGIDPGNGDTLKLKVFAYDNDIISGPNVGISNPITIKLKDSRSKHEETLNAAEQLMEELIDILADEINIADLGQKHTAAANNIQSAPKVIDTEQILTKQKRLTNKIENAKETLDMTIASMREDEYSDFTNFVALSNMEVRIKNLLYERKHLLESFAKLDIGRFKRLMNREVIEFEDDILFLDSMIKGSKLIDSLYSSNDLLNKYSELSELLKQMEQGSNGELADELKEVMDQISELMSELAEKMAGLSGEIQEGFLNQDAFQAMNMQDQLDEIAKLAQEGKVQEALQMLANMTESLQNMIASLENGMQSFGSSMMGQAMSELNELLSRIEEIEKQESLLRDNTDEFKQSLLDSDSNSLRDFINSESKKVRELKEILEEAKAKILDNSPAESNPHSAYLTDKMLDQAEQLENWLKAMDFKQAQKQAKIIEESSKGLRDASNSNFSNLGPVPYEIDRANRLASEIENDLEIINERSTIGDRLSGMAGRQDEIQSETDDLAKQLSEPESGFFAGPGMKQNLELAEDFMGSASQDLRSEQLSKAISNQDEALKALRQAKEQAQQMMQQMQMSARGAGMPAPMMLGQRMMQPGGSQGINTQFVEIPKVDESMIGKEYKQRILEAMKGGSPEGYIELNKKYYDRIIK